MSIFLKGELPTKGKVRKSIESVYIHNGEALNLSRVDKIKKQAPEGKEVKTSFSIDTSDEIIYIDFYYEVEESEKDFQDKLLRAKRAKLDEIISQISRYNLNLSNIKEIKSLYVETKGAYLADWQKKVLEEFLSEEKPESQLEKAREEGYQAGYNAAMKKIKDQINKNLG